MGWKGKAGEVGLSYHVPFLFAQFMCVALLPALPLLFLVDIEQVGKHCSDSI